MATRVLLTIDTELTWRHFVEDAGWLDNFRLSYDPAGVGIPYQLRLLKACVSERPVAAPDLVQP